MSASVQERSAVWPASETSPVCLPDHKSQEAERAMSTLEWLYGDAAQPAR